MVVTELGLEPVIRPVPDVNRLPDATAMSVTRTATKIVTGVVTIVMTRDANGTTTAASGTTSTTVVTGTVTIIIHVVSVTAPGMLNEMRTTIQGVGGTMANVTNGWQLGVNAIAGTSTKSETGSGLQKTVDPDGVLHVTGAGPMQKRARTGRTGARRRLNLLGWRRTSQRRPVAVSSAGGVQTASWMVFKPGRRA